MTIGLEELLLQKLQIIEMTTTDVIDVGALLATHDVSEAGDDPEAIDGGRIARLLGRDWGFHHTATRNLQQVRDRAGNPGTDFGPEANSLVRARAGRLLDAIAAEPKNARWRVRDRIGERKQWWQDVDDKEATY